MQTLSNSNYAEAIKLVSALKDLKGDDLKTINLKRRAKVLIRKLKK